MKSITGILSAVLLSFTLSAQNFVNVASDFGINHSFYGPEYGCGASFYDVNHDGWDDLTLVQQYQPVLLYLNNQGQLEDPIYVGGINMNPKGMSWCDYDNDGDADLMVCNYDGKNFLYQNNGDLEAMTDVTQEAGIWHDTEYLTFGLSWGDIDRDGDLDLYINNYNADGVPNEFYINNGDGTFTESGVEYGIDNGSMWSFQSLFLDTNHDLWPDLHVINDRLPATNNFYINQGGSFIDQTTELGMEMYIFSMNNSMADYDRDGDMDIYISNNPFGNYLMQQQEDGTYADVAEEENCLVNDHSWSALWMDYDNNGWEDLHVCTTPFWGEPGQNRFFINDQAGAFVEDAIGVGLQDDDGATSTSCLGDLNNDGYADFAVIASAPETSRVYQNQGGTNHFLTVELNGVVSNTEGIGCWIEVFTNGESQIRYTQSGEGYLTQNSRKEFFGLGEIETIDSLQIQWINGHIDWFYDLPADQHLSITEGSSLTAEISVMEETFCEGDSVLLIATSYANAIWNNEQIGDSIWISEPGEYYFTGYTQEGIPVQSAPIMVEYSENALVEIVYNHPSCHGAEDGMIELIAEVDALLWLNDEPYEEVVYNCQEGVFHYHIEQDGFCSSTHSVELYAPDSLYVDLVIDQPLCFEETGSVLLSIEGGVEPYIVDWFDEDPLDLLEGDYLVSIADAHNCLIDSIISVTAPGEIIVESNITEADLGDNGIINLVIEGGVEPYEVFWNGPDGYTGEGNNITDLEPGIYTGNVIDSHNCSKLVIVDLDGLSAQELNLNQVEVYPNPCDEQIFINGAESTLTKILVYDLNGRKIEEHTVLPTNEVTIVDVSSLSPGVYILHLVDTVHQANVVIMKK
ncbi:FG-GAP-like repeat-containing protein [Sanyastnella coralliicola]|uniref:FG-GAP-like repeat-containing protein n=1 Tax=Sanyastnella coralliicola TaxID=3069118 RepID=UPI0027BB0AB2|nr:FG-GAP-like repeat-containing protein [Longitalea sp. SCSIO 12813]